MDQILDRAAPRADRAGALLVGLLATLDLAEDRQRLLDLLAQALLQ